jgi:hypothetical protein
MMRLWFMVYGLWFMVYGVWILASPCSCFHWKRLLVVHSSGAPKCIICFDLICVLCFVGC